MGPTCDVMWPLESRIKQSANVYNTHMSLKTNSQLTQAPVPVEQLHLGVYHQLEQL